MYNIFYSFFSHRIDLFEKCLICDFLFSGMFDPNLDILNILGAISMKIGMYCQETLFQHIPAYFLI